MVPSARDQGPSRKLQVPKRVEAERALRSEDKVVCACTSTLEVGVDIGDIDMVILAYRPRLSSVYRPADPDGPIDGRRGYAPSRSPGRPARPHTTTRYSRPSYARNTPARSTIPSIPSVTVQPDISPCCPAR
jgi:hypothetical protein